MDKKQHKPVLWIGSSHEGWKTFPGDGLRTAFSPMRREG